MSGIVNGVNYSLLFSPAGSSPQDVASSILNALYGGAASVPPVDFVASGNPLLDLKLAQVNQKNAVALEAKQPHVSNAITAFTNAVAKATDINTALANPAIQQVLLTASGLSGYIGQTALVQKVLLSDPTDPSALVNKLGDGNALSTVQSYNFHKNGLSALKNPKVISTLTNAYAEVQWRQSLDQATPGLSNALTFISQASKITSVSDILDNLTNFEVITGALGIPLQIVNQDTSAQTAAITKRLDIAKLQDPHFVTSLTDQYLLTQQQNNAGSSTSTDRTTLAVRSAGLVV